MGIGQKNNGDAWLRVLVGVALIYFSYPPFLVYLQTGKAFARHSRSIPFDRYGGDAVLINGLCILAGLFLVAAGLRKLVFTK